MAGAQVRRNDHAVATLMRKTARIRSASRPAQMQSVGALIARSIDRWQLLRCIAGPLGLLRCPGAFGMTPRRRAAGEQDAGRLIAEDGESFETGVLIVGDDINKARSVVCTHACGHVKNQL